MEFPRTITGQFKKGVITPYTFTEGHKRGMTGKHHTKETILKIKEKLVGNPRLKVWKGRKRTPEDIEKSASLRRGKPRLASLGENNGMWKGGVSKQNRTVRANIMSSLEYKLWRKAVFERDNYTCIWCGFKGYIEADHIKLFADYPELRFAIDNGRTLCRPCHLTTDTFGGKRNYKNNNK